VIQNRTSNLQYIIIDGGSTDGTVELIQNYSEHIDYWISEPDKGIYDAMNKGWKAASENSFIMFLGAGDKLLSLPSSISHFETIDVVFGKVLIGEMLFNAKADFRLKMVNTLHHQALLIHKSLHQTQPFNTSYKVYADFDFNQRLLKEGARFIFSDTLFAYALPDGVSRKFYVRESLRVVHSNFGLGWSLLALPYYMYQGFKTGFSKISTHV